MNSENQIAKTVQLISVIALMIGASGCATQGAGGSKLDHDELISQVRSSSDTIQVCDQYGTRISCATRDRGHVIADLEYFRDSTR